MCEKKMKIKKTIDKFPIIWYDRKVLMMYRDVAQFGRVLRSGRRGRRFKSCHPDHVGAKFALLRFSMQKNIRLLPCSSFVAKRHARLNCALVNAFATFRCRYHLFARKSPSAQSYIGFFWRLFVKLWLFQLLGV